MATQPHRLHPHMPQYFITRPVSQNSSCTTSSPRAPTTSNDAPHDSGSEKPQKFQLVPLIPLDQLPSNLFIPGIPRVLPFSLHEAKSMNLVHVAVTPMPTDNSGLPVIYETQISSADGTEQAIQRPPKAGVSLAAVQEPFVTLDSMSKTIGELVKRVEELERAQQAASATFTQKDVPTGSRVVSGTMNPAAAVYKPFKSNSVYANIAATAAMQTAKRLNQQQCQEVRHGEETPEISTRSKNMTSPLSTATVTQAAVNELEQDQSALADRPNHPQIPKSQTAPTDAKNSAQEADASSPPNRALPPRFCRFWISRGFCNYGDNCHFEHVMPSDMRTMRWLGLEDVLEKPSDKGDSKGGGTDDEEEMRFPTWWNLACKNARAFDFTEEQWHQTGLVLADTPEGGYDLSVKGPCVKSDVLSSITAGTTRETSRHSRGRPSNHFQQRRPKEVVQHENNYKQPNERRPNDSKLNKDDGLAQKRLNSQTGEAVVEETIDDEDSSGWGGSNKCGIGSTWNASDHTSHGNDAIALGLERWRQFDNSHRGTGASVARTGSKQSQNELHDSSTSPDMGQNGANSQAHGQAKLRDLRSKAPQATERAQGSGRGRRAPQQASAVKDWAQSEHSGYNDRDRGNSNPPASWIQPNDRNRGAAGATNGSEWGLKSASSDVAESTSKAQEKSDEPSSIFVLQASDDW